MSIIVCSDIEENWYQQVEEEMREQDEKEKQYVSAFYDGWDACEEFYEVGRFERKP